MTNATPDALLAYLEWRQQDHIVDVGKAGRSYKRRQEPWPEDTVINHGTDVSQLSGSSCSCLNDDDVLAARLRQPRQDVALFDHGEEAVAGDQRARCELIDQVLRHR